MKKIYIIHPFQGKKENKERISKICKAVANMGYLPVSPVHTFSFLDDNIPKEREQALKLCKELIKSCNQAWLFGDWRNSEGCNIELEVAETNKIPVIDFEKLKELIK